MRRCSALLLALAVALSACAGDDPATTISRERFIEVNVALRRIEPGTPDVVARRAAVLREHGVTEDQLSAFVAARRDRLEELAEIWGEIQQRLESPPADTSGSDAAAT